MNTDLITYIDDVYMSLGNGNDRREFERCKIVLRIPFIGDNEVDFFRDLIHGGYADSIMYTINPARYEYTSKRGLAYKRNQYEVSLFTTIEHDRVKCLYKRLVELGFVKPYEMKFYDRYVYRNVNGKLSSCKLSRYVDLDECYFNVYKKELEGFQYYKSLLEMSYYEVVDSLLKKYGGAKYSYYDRKSYDEYMEGEFDIIDEFVKSKEIKKNKVSRTREGLYCHHIEEYNYPMLTNMFAYRSKGLPFEVHSKENLVYCDLVEHAILHVLIFKEKGVVFDEVMKVKLVLGIGGYKDFIKPDLIKWYIEGDFEGLEFWQKNCYRKSYMEAEEMMELISIMDGIIEPS